mgnify:CR=1 FL=1
MLHLYGIEMIQMLGKANSKSRGRLPSPTGSKDAKKRTSVMSQQLTKWIQIVVGVYRLSYLHQLGMAKMKSSHTYTQMDLAHVALRPFQEKFF